MPRCAEEEPALTVVEQRFVACHLYDNAKAMAAAVREPAAAVS
jgi:hypothetical protein